MEVVILSGADADLDEIYAFLEESSGGDKFLHSLDRKLELLRTFPEIAPRAQVSKLRQTRIGKTPYGVFYSIEGKRLMIVAIQDLRQDPKTIARIIRGRL